MTDGRVRSRSHAVRWALVLLLAAGSCSSPPKPAPPIPIEPVSPDPTEPRADAIPAVEALPADSTIAEPKAIPSQSRNAGSGKRTTPPAEAEAAPADSLPPPTISVRLSDEEKSNLRQEAERNLRSAREALARLELRGRDESMRESIATLRDLVDSAQTTEGNGDLQAAAQLARKARLLAEELLAR